MSTFHQVIKELAASDVPVLLLGEPGVGKHVVARQIHDSAPWSGAPFIECRCKETTEDAIRVIFGGDRGNDLPSTLYLEAVEELSSSGQKVLLTCMEASASPRWPRVIASASPDLEMDVRTGKFREDLYYRLCGICLPIPPLRYRKEDLNQLAETFLEKYSEQFSRPKPELSSSLLRFLHSHPWSGNLVELEDAMRTVVAIGNVKVAISALRSASEGTNGREKKNGDAVSLKQVARAASQRAERELILKVLTRTNWNRKRAAEELRISYKALLYKLKEIGAAPGTHAGHSGRSE